MIFARPHQYLYGGWDPGEYISTAAHIDRTGAISFNEPFLVEAPPDVARAFMHNPKYPRPTLQAGYLVVDETSGAMVPDYFHLYPVWLALFAWNGVAAAYTGQTVIALWGVLTVVFFTRRFAGNLAAALVAPLLFTNPALVYFGRFPSSELLSMTVVFALAFLWFAHEARPSRAGAFWIGVAAFSAATAHITNLLPLAGMGMVAGALGWLQKDRPLFSGAKALALGTAFGVIRNAWATPLFVGALIEGYVIQRPDYVVMVLGAFLLLGALLAFLYKFALPRVNGGARAEALLDWTPAWLALGWGLYHFFLRPRGSDHHDAINLRSLGWLVSPAGLLAAWSYFLTRDWKRAGRAALLFLTAVALSAAVLVHHKHVQPYYMWAFRRYLPVVIPALAVLMASAAGWCARKRLPFRLQWLPVTLLVILAGWQMRQSRPFLRIREHAGLPAFTEKLAADMADADFILADHWRFPSPLRYGHGLPAYTLSHENAPVDARRQAAVHNFLREKTEAGKRVYYLSHRGPFHAPSLHPRVISKQVHEAEALAWNQRGLPYRRQPANSTANVYLMRPRPETDIPEATFIDIGYHSLGLSRGFHGFMRSRGMTFRWTDGDAALYIPTQPRGGEAILHIAHMRPDSHWDTVPVEITLDGEPWHSAVLGPGWNDLSVPLPPSDAGVHLLGIKSDTWDPADFDTRGFPPNLGLRLASVRVAGKAEDAE